MAFLHILVVSVLAALSSWFAGSLILDGKIEPLNFIPLLFTLYGSLLVLAPGYGAMNERAITLKGRYLVLLMLGAGAGSLLLGIISGGNPYGTLVGGFYGTITAGCWIAIHFLSKSIVSRSR